MQGLGVHVSPVRTEITRTREVVGEKGRRIRELTSVVQLRFPEDSVKLSADGVENRASSAIVQTDSLAIQTSRWHR